MTATAPRPGTGPHADAGRVSAIEGFRGVAVLMVVAFHYLADMAMRETSIAYYPFGDRYAHPLLTYGKTGVQFFFIISGFVIALTLERCSHWREFAVKRAARLMPGMLICTAITYIVLSIVPQKIWVVHPIDILPSLTMLGESVWTYLLGVDVAVVDGVYWSLFVEVQFYLLAAVLYFGARRIPLIWSLTGVFLLMMVVVKLGLLDRWPTALDLLKSITLYDRLPFFLIGAGFQSIASKHLTRSAWAVIGFALAITFVRNIRSDPGALACYGVYVALFGVLIIRPQLLRPFEWRPLLVLGAASYTVYLLHNRIGVSLTYNLGPYLPEALARSLFLPACMFVLCLGAAMAIDRYFDAPLRRAIVSRYARRN